MDYKDGVADVFGRAAPTYDRVGSRVFGHFGARLVEHAHLQPGWRVLDIACGRGAVLLPAAERVGPTGSVLGIDLSEPMVAEIQGDIHGRGIQNAEVRHLDAEHLDLPEASFDAVLCGFGLMFLPNLACALRGMRRVLRPGGIIGVTTWAPQDARWFWRTELLKQYATQTAPSRLVAQDLGKREELAAALENAGFASIRLELEPLDVCYPDEETWWNSLWAEGRRASLDAMTPDALAAYEAEVFAAMPSHREEDGYHETRSALIAVGCDP